MQHIGRQARWAPQLELYGPLPRWGSLGLYSFSNFCIACNGGWSTGFALSRAPDPCCSEQGMTHFLGRLRLSRGRPARAITGILLTIAADTAEEMRGRHEPDH